jgi:hypothetical protein
MTVRLWELATTLLVFLLATIFLLGGQPIEGAVAAALAIFWVVGRATVPEWLGYRYVSRHAALELVRVIALVVVLLAAMATMFVALALGWNHDREGPFLFIALAGVMVLLRYEIERRFGHYENLADGGRAEVEVGEILDGLDRFDVEHNWLPSGGFGNVDHIVRRESHGAWFAIETKSGWFRVQNASQVIRNALAVKQRVDARWVTPVVCVGKAKDPVREHRQGKARVWVVRRDQLASWLPSARSTQTYR